jgi:serine/threonine-protein kinase
MSSAASPDRRLISDEIDQVELFARAAGEFADTHEILQLVAASTERALFVARDRTLKRRVALRVHLRPETASRAWFMRETELLAALDHPVLRPVYGAGRRGEWAYRMAKWIDGESLTDTVARAVRPIPAVLHLARDLAGVLEYVHTQNIVIRKLAPTTLMIDNSERTFVTDLRFANVCLDVAGPDDDPVAEPFLAPEVRAGDAGEPGSDIYSAGALLYYAATGRPPPLHPEELVPPRSLRPAVPRALERVILRAMKKEPAARYLTAAEMADDLLSELGELTAPTPLASERSLMTEDQLAWEKRLRRALGDDYELLDELGSGGFGRVYLVRDLALEREVALKVLHPYLTRDPAVVERFRREARAAAQMMHPHIVNTYDIGRRAGLMWYTMEYVRGKNLARLIESEGQLPLERVLHLMREALSALHHAHSRGLVHRDIKPENLLVEDATGALHIADFGLVLAIAGAEGIGGPVSQSGTPEFAAPEQLLGERVDHRADLYSLTLAAYYALTGTTPFGGGTVESVLARQTVGRLPSIAAARDDVPAPVIRVLEQGAAREPADRFDSAEAYARALRDATSPAQGAVPRFFRTLFGQS